MPPEVARAPAEELAAAQLAAWDPGTAEHSDEVVLLCETIARRLGLGEADREAVRLAARLHDVGKVTVPAATLNKDGPLDAGEWAVVRRHTVEGERLLAGEPVLEGVAHVVRAAHERWDGDGYPDGLHGEEIPLASRIVFCADAFHAVRCDRPYRAGRPAPAALAEVQAGAGTQFDPRVVEALVAAAEELRLLGKSGRGIGSRSVRLVALLTALTVGGGTAWAAGAPVDRWVRDAVRIVTGGGEARAPRAPEGGGGAARSDAAPAGARLELPVPAHVFASRATMRARAIALARGPEVARAGARPQTGPPGGSAADGASPAGGAGAGGSSSPASSGGSPSGGSPAGGGSAGGGSGTPAGGSGGSSGGGGSSSGGQSGGGESSSGGQSGGGESSSGGSPSGGSGSSSGAGGSPSSDRDRNRNRGRPDRPRRRRPPRQRPAQPRPQPQAPPAAAPAPAPSAPESPNRPRGGEDDNDDRGDDDDD